MAALLAPSFAGCADTIVQVEDADRELCRRGGQCSRVMHAANKLDLLIMVDNSNSMRDEQAALAAELPRMMEALLTGDLDGDGQPELAPIEDVHVGVVSSDMGLVGIPGIDQCTGVGDDGVLRTVETNTDTCERSTESFLHYDADAASRADAANEISCRALLGVNGCGFEQQLEAMLKALTPSSSDIDFWSEQGRTGGVGHGDTANAGFLRNDPSDPSLIAVVLITDEEDCSNRDPAFLDPRASTTGLNTRCFHEGQLGAASKLHPVQRYIDGLRALRPGHDNLVFFGLIAGVPPDAVSRQALAEVDFSSAAERDTFYEALLDHPKMQEVIDRRESEDLFDDNLVPVCDRGMDAIAYPARRMVEVARGFGSNAVVQSICQESFTSGIEPILQRMAAAFSGACLSERYERDGDGEISCDVLWRLPEESSDGVPAACSDADYLSVAGDGRPSNVCRVAQLPSDDGAPAGDGWYYDDFSERTRWCEGDTKQAIVFTGAARPPAEVTILFDCDE
jgi:hypothetical protein